MSLTRRLNQYSASTSTLQSNFRNWKMYAAVTGSAVAMATNASADIIYSYSGLRDIQAGPIASATVNSAHPSGTAKVIIRSHASHTPGFLIGVQQDLGHGSLRGAAYLNGGQYFGFLNSSKGMLKKLSSGYLISSGRAPFQNFYNLAASQNLRTSNHTGSLAGWAASKVGFAGFSFETTGMAQRDYGWLRLEFTVGANGAADKFQVIDWGYNNTGGSILAGQGAPAPVTTPEPSTGALALLAAGAGGVLALRRRRKNAA
jgi:hypothetical protein